MADSTHPPFSSFNFFESLFHKTMENNILLMDPEGKVITINKAFTDCFGYHLDDLKGKSVSLLFTKEDQKKGKPEKEIAQVIMSGQASDNNYLVRKDKEMVWVSGESVLVKNDKGDVCILKIIQDINRQKLNERSALQFSNLNEHILTAIDDIVIVLDSQLNILKTNRAFDSLFNQSHQKEVSNFEQLIRPYDPYEILIARIKNTAKNKTAFVHETLEVEIASGENRFYDFNCSPLVHTEEGERLLLVIHDITVDKQIEKEREDVIGFVAHELRNPLANLVLCNDLMTEAIQENSAIDLTSLLQRSKNNISRLNKMIAELYEATRVNSGILKLDIGIFHFGEMVREAIDTVEILQPSYQVIVKGDGNFLVSGDRYRMIQVVTNFLSNGIKYSNGKTEVILTIERDNNKVTVSVKDEGLGISPKDLPHVFERFFRAEKTKNLEGIGLGLFLCQQIVTAHHGRTWAESEEGRGSTFYFSIPVQ
jgi:PAS domain S-box-containing protein